MKRFLSVLCIAGILLMPVFANGEKEVMTSDIPVDETELSHDELVSAAKEEGKLVVYGTHSYIEKAAAAFEEKYGIQVSWTQLGETDLVQKISAECGSNAGGADLVYAQDGARIKSEWIAQDYIYNWKSKRLGALTGNEDMSLSVFEYSCKAFIWNNELAPGKEYLHNIWQIADPKYRGLFAMKDPYAEGVNFNFLTMLTSDENAEKMAEAYRAYYGKDIVLTTPNAGYEWIKAVYGNGMVLGTSDTRISEQVGAKGQDITHFGLFAVQRFATAETKDLALAMNTGMNPCVGFYYPIYSIILKQATHKNAAKLFVEFMLSEEGWKFWKDNVGDYNANRNLPYAGDISLDQWAESAILEDMDYVYRNRVAVEDFIVGIN